MESVPPKVEPLKRKRRWFQFRLRTLMIFTMIVAVPCALLGRRIERKRTEREIVRSIEALEGSVIFDYQLGPAGPRSEPFGPGWLRSLLGENFFSEVQIVDLRYRSVSDSQLVCLRELPQLQQLWLTRTKVTDAGLANLRDLNQLHTLILDATNVTDAGLANLNQLTGVRELFLSETKITDAGLASLTERVQITDLDLTQTKITDRGLASLKKLARLQRLHLNQTDTTDGGVADLQKALPNCKIER